MSAVAAHGREKVVKSENYHFDPVIPLRPFSQCRSLVSCVVLVGWVGCFILRFATMQ